jgi:hypothetical protein
MIPPCREHLSVVQQEERESQARTYRERQAATCEAAVRTAQVLTERDFEESGGGGGGADN